MEYNESQRFNQKWIWLLLLGLLAFSIYNLFNYSTSISTWIGFIVILLITVFSSVIRLDTKINKQGIHLSFLPFVNKTFQWHAIEDVEVINYGFVGGWGLRFSYKYGIVYNIRGNKGLRILLKDGKKLVIGTQKPEEINEVLARFVF